MKRETLSAIVAVLWLLGMFSGIALLAWMVRTEAGEANVAVVATLVGSLISHGSAIPRNLFPSAEPPQEKKP